MLPIYLLTHILGRRLRISFFPRFNIIPDFRGPARRGGRSCAITHVHSLQLKISNKGWNKGGITDHSL